jgi:hypothetical protein
VTDRELIWKFYAEYMAHGNLSVETLEQIAQRLKEPVSIADEWKLECIRMLEDIKHLQTQLNNLQ